MTWLMHMAAPARPWWMAAASLTAADVICAWQAKGAASQAASYADLSGRGVTLAPGVAPSWSAGSGWTGDGTQYLVGGTTATAAKVHQRTGATICVRATRAAGLNEAAWSVVGSTSVSAEVGHTLLIEDRSASASDTVRLLICRGVAGSLALDARGPAGAWPAGAERIVCVSDDGSTVRMTIDGAEVAVTVATQNNPPSTSTTAAYPLHVMAQGYPGFRYQLVGSLAAAVYLSRALTVAEMATMTSAMAAL